MHSYSEAAFDLISFKKRALFHLQWIHCPAYNHKSQKSGKTIIMSLYHLIMHNVEVNNPFSKSEFIRVSHKL